MNQHLSSFLKKQCQSIMNKICSRSISQVFYYPIDPIQDNCPNYFDIVKNPMDLGTIRKNLRNNKYTSVAEWKRDMELVWSNSILFHQKDSTIGLMALDLQKYYFELTKYLSDSYKSSWKRYLIELHQEFSLCEKEVVKCRRLSSQKVRTVFKRDQLYPIIEELPPPNFRRHFKLFTKEEVDKLISDINSLKEKSHIQMIISLLKEYEPNVIDDSGNFQVNLNELQPKTLYLIRDQVDQLINS